jgi:hypothetical protein
MRVLSLGTLLVALAALSGCVALPIVAPAAFSAGGDLVKAGTVRMGGATFRTFSAPLSEVYHATRKTLDSLGFGPPEEEGTEEKVTLIAQGLDRTVRIDLQPITGALTQMRVFVRKESLGKDPATASEIVAQAEQVLLPADPRQAQRDGERRARAR